MKKVRRRGLSRKKSCFETMAVNTWKLPIAEVGQQFVLFEVFLRTVGIWQSTAVFYVVVVIIIYF